MKSVWNLRGLVLGGYVRSGGFCQKARNQKKAGRTKQEFVLEVYVSLGRFLQKARKQEAISRSLQGLVLWDYVSFEGFFKRARKQKKAGRMRQEFVLEVYVCSGGFCQKARKQEAISRSLKGLVLWDYVSFEGFFKRARKQKKAGRMRQGLVLGDYVSFEDFHQKARNFKNTSSTKKKENQMELLQMAKRQLELYHKIGQTIKEQQKKAPKESLRVSRSNGTFQYYIYNNGTRKYILKINRQLAKQIAQRDYNQKIAALLKKNIQALKQFTKHYAPQEFENYFLKLPAARRLLISPFFVDNKTYANQWQAQKFEPNKDFPEGNLFTNKNEHVRSKSEVIIANLLNSNGVPYHYEAPVKISSTLTFHPDFLCLNKRTRQEFYWEHCGMMDDSEYSERLVHRLSLLAQKNIIPGKNLILTMETLEHPLNTKDVERMIKIFLE